MYVDFKLFEEGQAYEALSLVKSLEGLYIKELDCEKIRAGSYATKRQ